MEFEIQTSFYPKTSWNIFYFALFKNRNFVKYFCAFFNTIPSFFTSHPFPAKLVDRFSEKRQPHETELPAGAGKDHSGTAERRQTPLSAAA